MTMRPRHFLPGVLGADVPYVVPTPNLASTTGNGPIAGYTVGFNLNLVNFDWVTWHDYEWENWVVVDTLLQGALSGLVIRGAWRPNTAYLIGDVVVDTQNGAMLICDLDHTSSSDINADIALGYWNPYETGDAFVAKSGDTMTGDLFVRSSTPDIGVWNPNAPTTHRRFGLTLADSGTASLVRRAEDGSWLADLVQFPSGDAVFASATTLTLAPRSVMTLERSDARFYTKTQLDPVLADMVTDTELTAALGNYYTKSQQNATDVAQDSAIAARVLSTTYSSGQAAQDALISANTTNANNRVAKAGDTMTGMLTLPATLPSIPAHATNKTYVDTGDGARLRWRGVWVAGTYLANDMVQDGEFLFIATATTTEKPNNGTNPPTPVDWYVLTSSGGGASVHVGATPPPLPVQGDLWYANTDPVGLFVWYEDEDSGQWVQANGGGTAEGGIVGPFLPLTGGVMSADAVIQFAPRVPGPPSSPNTGDQMRWAQLGEGIVTVTNSLLGSITQGLRFRFGGSGGVGGTLQLSNGDTGFINLTPQTALLSAINNAGDYGLMFNQGIKINLVNTTVNNVAAGHLAFIQPAAGNSVVDFSVVGGVATETHSYRFGRTSTPGTTQQLVLLSPGTTTSKCRLRSDGFVEGTGWGAFGAAPINIAARSDGVQNDNYISHANNAINIQSGVASTATQINFRSSQADGGTICAAIGAAGTTMANSNTVPTRASGDARWAALSSVRYKQGIEDADMGALVAAFDAFVPRTWTWGGEVPQADERWGAVGIGLIAEEVVQSVPEAVRYQWVPQEDEGEEGPSQQPTQELRIDGLDALALHAVLIAKIRQLEARIQVLETL